MHIIYYYARICRTQHDQYKPLYSIRIHAARVRPFRQLSLIVIYDAADKRQITGPPLSLY